jgi:acetyl esterase/lipase
MLQLFVLLQFAVVSFGLQAQSLKTLAEFPFGSGPLTINHTAEQPFNSVGEHAAILGSQAGSFELRLVPIQILPNAHITARLEAHDVAIPPSSPTAMEAAQASSATPTESLRLWPGTAPFAMGDTPADLPSIDVYLPASNPTHTGVLVHPGGGYSYVSLEHEGSHVAQWLTQHGVAAFVLHYRVAPYRYPAPLLDGERAMRLIRSRAGDFGVAPDHIGVWGFSAGGHIASTLMTHFGEALTRTESVKQDALDSVSDRPDFGILAYAVISMMPGTTHPGSHDKLLGNPADPKLEVQLSNELHVQPDSPPAFLFATTDDPKVPVANSVLFYQAYVTRHLSVEMHLYEHGDHGAGLAEGVAGLEAWPGQLAAWMRIHGWMAAAGAPTEK